MEIQLRVNGQQRIIDPDPSLSLLRALRGELGLTGTKDGCEEGECGSCTVWLAGDIVCACLVPIVQAADRDVVTIEGLGADASSLSEALLDEGGVQCGFCTPGMIVAAADWLRRDEPPTEDAVREALAGNLCRCTGYGSIVDAVQRAAARRHVELEP